MKFKRLLAAMLLAAAMAVAPLGVTADAGLYTRLPGSAGNLDEVRATASIIFDMQELDAEEALERFDVAANNRATVFTHVDDGQVVAFATNFTGNGANDPNNHGWAPITILPANTTGIEAGSVLYITGRFGLGGLTFSGNDSGIRRGTSGVTLVQPLVIANGEFNARVVLTPADFAAGLSFGWNSWGAFGTALTSGDNTFIISIDDMLIVEGEVYVPFVCAEEGCGSECFNLCRALECECPLPVPTISTAPSAEPGAFFAMSDYQRIQSMPEGWEPPNFWTPEAVVRESGIGGANVAIIDVDGTNIILSRDRSADSDAFQLNSAQTTVSWDVGHVLIVTGSVAGDIPANAQIVAGGSSVAVSSANRAFTLTHEITAANADINIGTANAPTMNFFIYNIVLVNADQTPFLDEAEAAIRAATFTALNETTADDILEFVTSVVDENITASVEIEITPAIHGDTEYPQGTDGVIDASITLVPFGNEEAARIINVSFAIPAMLYRYYDITGLINPSFLHELRARGHIDTPDGEPIFMHELAAVTRVDVSGAGLTSLEGIEFLSGLTVLLAQNNNISSLDLSRNTRLNNVVLQRSGLTSLTLGGLTQLTHLNVSGNGLTTLNVTGLTALRGLSISDNNLVNVVGLNTLSSLRIFWAENNNFTQGALNVVGLSNLQIFDVLGNTPTLRRADVIGLALPYFAENDYRPGRAEWMRPMIRQGARFDADNIPSQLIVLTFDDGPFAHSTELLNILEQHNVRATFFLQGNRIGANPAIVQAMFNAGHDVENHTWSHPNLGTAEEALVRQELEQTSAAINNVIGRNPTMFRPAFLDAGSPGSPLRTVAAEMGMAVINANVMSNDWESISAQQVANNVLNSAGIVDGGIILLHEHSSAAQRRTKDALPIIIEGLRARGFGIVSISEYLEIRGISLTPGTVYNSLP